MSKDIAHNSHSTLNKCSLEITASRRKLPLVQNYEDVFAGPSREKLKGSLQIRIRKNSASEKNLQETHVTKNFLESLHNQLTTGGKERGKYGLIVVTYPNHFFHFIAPDTIELPADVEEIMHLHGPSRFILCNPKLFEGLLMSAQNIVKLSVDTNNERNWHSAKHLIAIQPSTLHMSGLNTYRFHSFFNVPSQEQKFAQSKAEVNQSTREVYRIHPTYVNALMNITKRFSPTELPKKANVKKAFIPTSLLKTIRYLSYCLLVSIPQENRSGSCFPHFASCDKLLTLEEFIGWYLPMCWTAKVNLANSSGNVAQTHVASDCDSYDFISNQVQNRLRKLFSRGGNHAWNERYDFVYYHIKPTAFLKSIFLSHVKFSHFSDLHRYLNASRNSRRSRGYIRLTDLSKKNVIGYVFEDSLVQSFAAWQKEVSEKFCQRCGETHLTIDCPWLFISPSIIYEESIHKDVMSRASSYCSAHITEKMAEIEKHAASYQMQNHHENSRKDCEVIQHPGVKRKRGRPKENRSIDQNIKSNAHISSENKYKCSKCSKFSTGSYAVLFRHMHSDCSGV